MSEIQSIAQNNYILATQQEVSHDNTLSGNGTNDSPLGLNPTWVNITTECEVRNISNDSSMTFLYSPALGMVNWTFKFKANEGGTLNSAYRVCTIPEEYRPYSKFELSNSDGSNYCDYFPENGLVIPRGANGYFSNSMTWPVSSLVQ
jgi:hypothetical protein